MTPRIDDLRVGQDQVNEPDVLKVVGHLVDEEGSLAPLHPGALQVSLAEFHDIRLSQARKNFGIIGRWVAARFLAQFARHRDDIRQFARAVDLAVTRQYLLHKGRAVAANPDDEYLNRGGKAPYVYRMKKLIRHTLVLPDRD